MIDETLAGSAGEVRKLGMEVSFAGPAGGGVPDRGRRAGGDGSQPAVPPLAGRARPSRWDRRKGVARVLGTRYPIVQGPMSRVSDTPAFAAAVAEAGGLPVMAIAAMREDELEPMLRDTRDRLGRRPVGGRAAGLPCPRSSTDRRWSW